MFSDEAAEMLTTEMERGCGSVGRVLYKLEDLSLNPRTVGKRRQ